MPSSTKIGIGVDLSDADAGFRRLSQAGKSTADDLIRSFGGVGRYMDGIANAVTGMATRYLGAAAAVEASRRAFMQFATTEDTMRRMQVQAGVTYETIKQFVPTFQRLAAESGRSLEEVMASFNMLRERAHLTWQQTENLFPTLVKGAFAANISLTEMATVFSTMIFNLRITGQEAENAMGILHAGAKAANLSIGELAGNLPELTSMMRDWGEVGTGSEAKMLAGLSVLKDAFGDTGQAAQGLTRMWVGMADPQIAAALGRTPQGLRRELRMIQQQGGSVWDYFVTQVKHAVETGTLELDSLNRYTKIAFGAYINNLDEVGRRTDDVLRKQKDLNRDVETINKTPMRAVLDLLASFKELGLAIGQAFDTVGVTELTAKIAGLVRMINVSIKALDLLLHPKEWSREAGAALDKEFKNAFEQFNLTPEQFKKWSRGEDIGGGLNFAPRTQTFRERFGEWPGQGQPQQAIPPAGPPATPHAPPGVGGVGIPMSAAPTQGQRRLTREDLENAMRHPVTGGISGEGIRSLLQNVGLKEQWGKARPWVEGGVMGGMGWTNNPLYRFLQKESVGTAAGLMHAGVPTPGASADKLRSLDMFIDSLSGIANEYERLRRQGLFGDEGALPTGGRPISYTPAAQEQTSALRQVAYTTDESLAEQRGMSTKLENILNVLKQAFPMGTGAGGTGGGGGGEKGPTFRPGIGPGARYGTSGGPTFRSGVGPGPRGRGTTLAQQYNNPGNVKYGPWAKAHGATGAGRGGHAIFPDYATGRKALEDMIREPRMQGKTLAEIGKWYAEDPNWAAGVGKIMGVDPYTYRIGPEDVPRVADAIQRQEGYGAAVAGAEGPVSKEERAMEPMAPTGSPTIPREQTTEVTTPSGRKLRVASDVAENFQGFVNDYERAGGVIGPQSGGLATRGNPSYHPLGRAIDINQVGYGIRGRGGKTLPVETENALARKWGIYPGSMFGRPDTGHFEVRNRAFAAAQLEKQRQLAVQQQGAAAPGAFEGGAAPIPFAAESSAFGQAAMPPTAPANTESTHTVKVRYERDPEYKQWQRYNMEGEVSRAMRDARLYGPSDMGIA